MSPQPNRDATAMETTGGCSPSTCPEVANDAEPVAPFPTLPLIAMMLVFLIAAIINGSIIMLVSALLPTPLLLWRLFVTLDEREVRRAAARKPLATTSTLNSSANPATTPTPQPTTLQRS